MLVIWIGLYTSLPVEDIDIAIKNSRNGKAVDHIVGVADETFRRSAPPNDTEESEAIYTFSRVHTRTALLINSADPNKQTLSAAAWREPLENLEAKIGLPKSVTTMVTTDVR